MSSRTFNATFRRHADNPTISLSSKSLQRNAEQQDMAKKPTQISDSPVLHHNIRHDPPMIDRVAGRSYRTVDGRDIYNASCGAAVSQLGHLDPFGFGNENMLRIRDAMFAQYARGPYAPPAHFTHKVVEQFAQELVDSTGGKMVKVLFSGSGTEGMGAMVKVVLQYYQERSEPEPARVNFIARWQSYHGTCLTTLALGGHRGRRAKFERSLSKDFYHVSPCHAYRGLQDGESSEQYVARLKKELIDKIEELGKETVCAFVAEPVVGAALGCAVAERGYFQAMAEVCRDYDILLVLDEVMCGMGRVGSLHAWEQEGIVPDIQVVGKGLAAGVDQVSAVLLGPKVVNVLGSPDGSAVFSHGHTFQAKPMACAAGLEVQRIIREQGLVERGRKMGDILEKKLKERIGPLPNVGDIRGRYCFQAIEFVKDKQTKQPYPRADRVVERLHELGLSTKYSIYVYPGTGWADADGIDGDGIIIAPAFTVTEEELELIVDRTARLIEDFFLEEARS